MKAKVVSAKTWKVVSAKTWIEQAKNAKESASVPKPVVLWEGKTKSPDGRGEYDARIVLRDNGDVVSEQKSKDAMGADIWAHGYNNDMSAYRIAVRELAKKAGLFK